MVPEALDALHSEWWTRLRDAKWFSAVLGAWLDPANKPLWAEHAPRAIVVAMHRRQDLVARRTTKLKRLMAAERWCVCKIRSQMDELFELLRHQEEDARLVLASVIQFRCGD